MRRKGREYDERFTRIYAEYYLLIFNTLYSKTGNEFDARDICHEVFLILYEKLDEIKDVRKWLFGTLRFAALRYYEKKKKTPDDIDTIFDDCALTYVNGFRDARIIISSAIAEAGLTEEERLLVDYIAFNSYTYHHTGKIMGLTLRQVGYKYLLAVRKIMEALKKRGIENIEDLL